MAKKEKALELTVPDNQYDIESVKNELKDYVTLEIKKQYNEELEKANRRLIKGKNKSLIWRDIIILLLIIIIGFLVYLMYKDGYFQRLFGKNEPISVIDDKKEEQKEEPKEEKKEEVKKPTFEELKKEYASLLNNIYINEKSEYLKDYYQGKITDELKNYLALNLVDFRELSKEDDYNIINNDTLRIKYNKIFDDEYKSVNFLYNGNEIRYISMLNSYVTSIPLEEERTNIKRDITNIIVDGDSVLIETEEYLFKEGKRYNVITNDEITEINNSVIKMIYSFKNGNLTTIENKNINNV